MKDDNEFTEEVITGVDHHDPGWTLKFGSSGLACPATQCTIAPNVGETARLYGRGFGYPVRGIVIGGRVYSYKTNAESNDEHARMVAEMKAKRRKAFDQKQFDVDLAALPSEFRDRIEQFVATAEDWKYEYGGYEMFSCKEAVKIARAMETAGAVREFAGKSFEQQIFRIPSLDEGHSGNTFGTAVKLAIVFLENVDMLPKMHGALCPLVGCDAYGCFSTRAKT